MSRRRQKPDEFESLAGDRSPEDGTDPKDFHAKPWNQPKQARRKAQQLCGQVKDVLHLSLAACGDPDVQAAAVVSVEPAPHTGRLLVILAARPGGGTSVAAGVSRAANHLRAEVAQAISRKFAPELVFEVVEVL